MEAKVAERADLTRLLRTHLHDFQHVMKAVEIIPILSAQQKPSHRIHDTDKKNGVKGQ